MPFKIRWRFNVHTDLLWKRNIIVQKWISNKLILNSIQKKKSKSLLHINSWPWRMSTESVRSQDIQNYLFKPGLWHAVNPLSTLIFLWFGHRGSELCLIEILKNNNGKHKKWTMLAVLHGNCTIAHRNTTLSTVFEYIVNMPECLFIWVVFFSMNLPHPYLDLW